MNLRFVTLLVILSITYSGYPFNAACDFFTGSFSGCTLQEVKAETQVVEGQFKSRGFRINKFQGSEELIMKDLIKPPVSYSVVPQYIRSRRHYSDRNNIIILSSRMGMGKSTLSLYLSQALAVNGDNVLLLDMDPLNCSLSKMVNEISDAPVSGKSQSKNNDAAYLVSLNPNLDFLSNLSCREIYDNVSVQKCEFVKTIEKKFGAYPFTIFDTQTGLNDLNLSLLQNVNSVILVTTPDETAIFETYALIKAANSFLNNKKLFLIINQVIDDEAGKYAHKELNFTLSHFLNFHITLLGMIPHDYNLESSGLKIVQDSRTELQQNLSASFQQVSQEVAKSDFRVGGGR